MAGKTDNKLITIILAIIILIAIVTIVYINLPEEETKEDDTSGQDTNNNNTTTEDIILSLIYESQDINLTLSELEEFEAYSGSGSYIKTKVLPEVIINGPYNLTGVNFTTIINQVQNLPENYNVTVTASDGWSIEYTKDQINGALDLYNKTGEITEDGIVTMILAYKEDGEYITDEEVGPLRIAFIGDNAITSSSLWLKMVESIEIIEV